MNILALTRDPQFSPNSVAKDRAILDAVADRLRQSGHEVTLLDEQQWAASPDDLRPAFVFSMGRLPQTLERLAAIGPVPVVNPPEAVRLCQHRLRLSRVMQQLGVPLPPGEGRKGYWLKRADACAQGAADVVFAADKSELLQRREEMRLRGIAETIVQAHVEGDLVKFYGVAGTAFFRHFYPTDDGDIKFSDELRNGAARHYSFSAAQLHAEADRLARAVRLSVYGGDCIVRPDGSFCLIDFNDWPSFSRCRPDAASAIASLAG